MDCTDRTDGASDATDGVVIFFYGGAGGVADIVSCGNLPSLDNGVNNMDVERLDIETDNEGLGEGGMVV